MTLLGTPLVRALSLRQKNLYKGDAERWSGRHVSRSGGIAIFAAIIIPVSFLVPLSLNFAVLISAALVVFLLGLVDDLVGLRPYVKLMGQLIASSVLVSVWMNTGLLSDIRGPVFYFVYVLWITGLTNAFNLLDNMDGLASGIAFITALFLFIYNYLVDPGNHLAVMLPLALSGAALGFLRYNFKPAKIYMGDCGSLPLGFLISICAIANTTRTTATTANILFILLVPVLILVVPIFDTTFVMILRKLNRISIFQGGSDHTSHRVVRLGLSEKKAVVLFYLISAFFGVLGIIAITAPYPYLYAVVGISFVLLVMFGVFLGKLKVYRTQENGVLIKKEEAGGPGMPLLTELLYKRQFLEVLVDFFLIFIAYLSAFYLVSEKWQVSANRDLIIRSLPLIVLIKLMVFYFTHIYKGIWQYIGFNDLKKLFTATVISSAASAAIIKYPAGMDIPCKIFVVDWMVFFLLAEITRSMEKTFSNFFDSHLDKEKRVLIYGAGDKGVMVLHELRNDKLLSCKVEGFIDDDPGKHGKTIDGVRIMGSGRELSRTFEEKGIDEIIISSARIPDTAVKAVEQLCPGNNVLVRRVNKLVS
jgi:UDP-GlcNAc:undecaprenyl-phosphate GlcNAc-1-phosphate transferase